MILKYLHEIQFDWPWMFGLVLVWPIWLWVSWRRMKRNQPAILHPSTAHLYAMKTWRIRLRYTPLVLRSLAMLALVAALAKPARYQQLESIEGNGIDIMLCLDVSGSMLARDFEPDRLVPPLSSPAIYFTTPRRQDWHRHFCRSKPGYLPAYHR